MRKLEEIDRTHIIDIHPYQQHLDTALTSPVEDLQPIIIENDDVGLFLDWVSCDTWRSILERDLQCLSEDLQGNPLLTTWIPLVTFRYELCAGGRQTQDEATQKLMDRLYIATRSWRDAGCDKVDICGYKIIQEG